MPELEPITIEIIARPACPNAGDQSFKAGRETYFVGETLTANDDETIKIYQSFCKAGWAKDLAGKVRTGKIPTAPVVIEPDTKNVEQNQEIN